MIISHLWLSRRNRDDDPSEQFLALVTNLETKPLHFGFRYVVSQDDAQGAGDCTETLRACVGVLVDLNVPASMVALERWTNHGRSYSTAYVTIVHPGETVRSGLETTKAVGQRRPANVVYEPDGFLRGHWELTLPALPKQPHLPDGPRAPQLDRPARVLVTALRRQYERSPEGELVEHETWPFPLASGKSEHLIAADRAVLIGSSAAAGIGASSKRAAGRGPTLSNRAATKGAKR